MNARQCTNCIEECLLKVCNFQRLHGANKLYVISTADGDIVMLLAKVTDGMIMAGTPKIMEVLFKTLEQDLHLSRQLSMVR